MINQIDYFKPAARFIFSLFVLLFFTWLSLFPIWQQLDIFPHFFILIYFNWLLYRPDLVGISHVICIGLIQDGLYNHPLGFSLLHLLILFTLLIKGRRLLLGCGFFVIYATFIGFSFIDVLLSWGMLSIYHGISIDIIPFLKGCVLVVLLYPLMSVASLALQKKLSRYSS